MKIIDTADGSQTIYTAQFDETYHSGYGAMAESLHVFIEKGLMTLKRKEINIFEAGFGTGLNAWLSWIYGAENKINIHYAAIELYPITADIYSQLTYTDLIPCHEDKFQAMHNSAWEETISLTPDFSIQKIQGSLLDHTSLANLSVESFDIIFFDAFAPTTQPELWSTAIFQKMYKPAQKGTASWSLTAPKLSSAKP